MNAIVLQAVVLIASLIILFRTEPALNRMSGRTPVGIRLAFCALAVGAVSMINGIILSGYVPTASSALVTMGVALLLNCERRFRNLLAKGI